MAIITIGLGFMMLIAGRPIYAVYTGGVGFVISTLLFENYIPLPAGWSPVVAGVTIAIISGGAAFAFRHWAAAVAGALAGAYMVFALPSALGASPGWAGPLLMIIVGIICFVAELFLFEISTVALSAMMAATMIVPYLRMSTVPPAGVFVILLVFSAITQFLLYQYGKSIPD